MDVDAPRDARADDLIEGPRGRRMLYELARLADDGLHSFAWDVERGFDTGGSTHVIVSAPSTSRGRARTGRPPRAQGVEDIARRIAAGAGHYRLDASALVAALAESVSRARAWQEPDGTDSMLEDPAFAGALRPLAERVARMPEAMWWWHPLAAQQTVTQFSYADPETRVPQPPCLPVPRDTAAQLARWRTAALEMEQRFAADAARHPRIPLSGDWWVLPQSFGVWSTPSLGERGPAALHFVEDAGSESLARVWEARVREGARVLEIAGPDDWAGLCRRHPLDVTASRRRVWGLATGRQGRWAIPDWTAVAAEWDAVHLTVAGYLRTAERAVPVDAGMATVLAGWDPAATVWFGEAIELTGASAAWRLDEVWTRVAG